MNICGAIITLRRPHSITSWLWRADILFQFRLVSQRARVELVRLSHDHADRPPGAVGR
jgi:hypothetical protein